MRSVRRQSPKAAEQKQNTRERHAKQPPHLTGANPMTACVEGSMDDYNNIIGWAPVDAGFGHGTFNPFKKTLYRVG